MSIYILKILTTIPYFYCIFYHHVQIMKQVDGATSSVKKLKLLVHSSNPDFYIISEEKN